MAYFDYLPNHYVWETNSIGGISKKLVKNIFRRVILSGKIERYVNSYEAYYIEDGERPESVAYNFYGDPELDWIILTANNITDPYTQWPMDSNTLLSYVNDIYDNPDGVHHYETNEILDTDGSVLYKEGIEVNENFRAVLSDNTTLSKNQSLYTVTNIEYETMVNERRRVIGIPDNNFVDFFTSEIERLMEYQSSDELDKDGDKTTTINSTAKYLERTRYRRDGQSVTDIDDSFTADTLNEAQIASSIAESLSNNSSTSAEFSTASTQVVTTNVGSTSTTSVGTSTTTSSSTSSSGGGGY